VEQVLKLAGCAWLGLPGHLRTLDGAVGWLGLLTVRGLVLSAEAFRGIPDDAPIGAARLTYHGFRTAELAARIARDMCPAEVEVAYLAATVHDIGRLVLGSRDRSAYQAVLEHARAHGVPLPYAERTLMGTTHAEVGATLLETWGLPAPVVGAVRTHHTPPSTGRWNAAAALFVANGLLDEALGGPRLGPDDCGRIHAPEARWTTWRERIGLPL
jgi:putative nucleotidyltransferase with HDIG domain